tara:strand:+ start:1325 stop:2116 length:792 start_codon:yes stop_codon:yes gene_type:complete
VEYKIGFLISEFLPTRNIVLKSLSGLNPDKLKIYKIPIYSPQKKSNNKLLLRVLKDTSIRYIGFKIFDTIIVRLLRSIRRTRIDNYAKKLKIKTETLTLDISEINKAISRDKIDILVLSTNQIVPESTLNSAKIIAVNVHLAKLPEYGGLFNQFWLMVEGEERSYACVHKASKNLDAGQVILEDSVEIRKEQSLLNLYIQTSILAGDILYKFLSNPGIYLDSNLSTETTPTIRGLPNRKDMSIFKKNSLKLIKLNDLTKIKIF